MSLGDILADVGAFANPFGAPSVGQWNLKRGIFIQNVGLDPQTPLASANDANSVIFFYEDKDPSPTDRTAVDQINDTGGRRLAVYEYPYIDGQKISDLGRKGESFNFNIKFFGLDYQQTFNQFLKVVVNFNGQGILIHPVRGALTVRFQNWDFLHRHDEWNAITIKATFIEDNTGKINSIQIASASQDSALRSALNFLVSSQASIQQGIFSASALLLLPTALQNAMQQRLTAIIGQSSGVLGQLAATFSSNLSLQLLASQSQNIVGGIAGLSSGTAVVNNQTASLPPIYQVGFDPVTQTAINAQIANFVSANQVTPQKAVFNANQARAAISAAIAEINTNLGNSGYDIMVQYRGIAVSIQQATEAAIASIQSQIQLYTTPRPMSLRIVAQNTGLTPDRQNDIESLNPFLGSVNYVPAGVQLIVPAA